MKSTETSIPADLLLSIHRWLSAVVNKESTKSGDMMTPVGIASVLTDTLGKDLTFGVFARLDGSMLVQELRQIGIRVPAIAATLFTGFAKAWSDKTPMCTDADCAMPAIRPLKDKSGVEILPEGTLCPWCNKTNVKSSSFQSTIRNWVTGEQVSIDQDFDITSVPGARLPHQEEGEEGLRASTDPPLRDLLDQEQVLVRDWLYYLICKGGATFGLSHTPLAIFGSLSDYSVIRHPQTVVRAQIREAKKFCEMEAVAPTAGVLSTSEGAATFPKITNRDKWFSSEHLNTLVCFAVNKQLDPKVLLSGIHKGYVASLANGGTLIGAHMVQLASLNQTIQLTDGSIPMLIWLKTALSLTQHLPDAEILRMSIETIERIVREAGAPAMTRAELHEKLVRLLPAQFEEVLFIVKAQTEYLPSAHAPMAQRVSALLQFPSLDLREVEKAYRHVTRSR